MNTRFLLVRSIGRRALNPVTSLVIGQRDQRLVPTSSPRLPPPRSAFLRQQRCVTEAGLLPERPGLRANTRPVNPHWHSGGAEGLPAACLAPRTPDPRLSVCPPPVLLMSDFKLGIVRLGRVAGKVSWSSGLPCAAGKGPPGTTKGDGKTGFSGMSRRLWVGLTLAESPLVRERLRFTVLSAFERIREAGRAVPSQAG